MNRLMAVLLLAMAPVVAMAGVDESIENLVVNVARQGHTIEAMVQDRAVVAVLISGTKCKSVGVIYPSRGSRGGQRIDNFRVCGAEVEALDEVSPALPSDSGMQRTTALTIRGALRYEKQLADWQGYRISALRLTPMDANGCGQVETIVSYEGLLVAHQVGRMCP